MPKVYTYVGKSILQEGDLLSIPSHLREAFNIIAGDSLEMHVEWNMLVLKPTEEFGHRTSGTHNLIWFPSIEKEETLSSLRNVKFPLRLVEGQINKVV
jgi:bifunctional DNA-binding transcriptional regulator/antitoxin component of YhaV-PrlF toxin-antitoxin module